MTDVVQLIKSVIIEMNGFETFELIVCRYFERIQRVGLSVPVAVRSKA